MTATGSHTIVSFHAHPDDEALLTAGTLARASAEGHRVVVVVATAGEAGLADAAGGRPGDLGARRTAELDASCRAIGAHRVVVLGHPDSGWTAGRPDGPTPFARLDVEPLAAELAAILVEESADVLTCYDEWGGYGHPDHVQVHRVGRRAAELAATPVVLEATVDRDLIARVVRALRWIGKVAPVPQLPEAASIYVPRAELTHRVDVRAHLPAKLASLRAHTSQATGGSARTLGLLLRLPGPLRRAVLGREWFREVGRVPGGPLLDDVFASLR